MRDRRAAVGPIVALSGALGVCCGLPMLLSLGVLGAVAGVSLQIWVVVGVGLALVGVGGTRWATRPASQNCDLPAPRTAPSQCRPATDISRNEGHR